MRVWIAYEVELLADEAHRPVELRRAVGWFRTEELAKEWLEEPTIRRRAIEELGHIQRPAPRHVPLDVCEDCGLGDVEVTDYPTLNMGLPAALNQWIALCDVCRERRRA